MKPLAAYAVAALLTLVSCSSERASTPKNEWVTASSLSPPNVPYTPNPIIVAREQRAGIWIWYRKNAPTKAITLEQLLSELVAVKSLRPEPLVLFNFTHHADRSGLAEVKSRIADAAGCSNSSPCVEGTPEQLR